MNDHKIFGRGNCATCGGDIIRVQLFYGGKPVGRDWIHQGLGALAAQTSTPHAARPGAPGRKDTHVPTKTAQTKAPAKATSKTASKATKASDASKSDTMRAMFAKGSTVAEVAKATGSHYSFAHGVMRRMVASGALRANATTARAPKSTATAKATATRKAGIAKANAAPTNKPSSAKAAPGRPTAARRQANRKAAATA